MAKVKRFEYLPVNEDDEAGPDTPDLLWADYYARPSWGQMSAIMDLYQEQTDERQLMLGTLRIMVKDWSLRDAKGKKLECEQAALEDVDGGFLVALHDKIGEALAVTLPKK